jgi:RnfABCDGE-type electron transport complex G subunit
VLPRELYDNDLLQDSRQLAPSAELGLDEATRPPIARAWPAKSGGAGLRGRRARRLRGKIRLLLAVAADGRLLGVRVTQHKETPGLGDYIEPRRTATRSGRGSGSSTACRWRRSGRIADWKVRKDGGRFDSRAGATVTPRRDQGRAQGLQYVAEIASSSSTLPAQSVLAAGRMKTMSREEFREIAQRPLEAEHQPGAVARPVPAAGRQHQLVNGVSLARHHPRHGAGERRRGGAAQLDPARNPHPGVHPDHRRAGHRASISPSTPGCTSCIWCSASSSR